MVSVLSIVVARRDGDAVGAHATLRQSRHQQAEIAERTTLHALARGAVARRSHAAVMARYELRHEALRAGSDERGQR